MPKTLRLLTLAGKTIRISHDPFGMAVSPDGSKTVTLHNGVFTIIDNTTMKSTMVGWYSSIPSPWGRPLFPYLATMKKHLPIALLILSCNTHLSPATLPKIAPLASIPQA